MNSGGCNCGRVTYQVSGALRPVIACHCTQCRKSSGHHVAATSALRETVGIQGPVTWYNSSKTARRGFCGNCGSNLFWDGPGRNISIMAGTLDKPTGIELSGHIFCADKGDYYCVADDLPKAEGADPNLTTMVGGALASGQKRS